MIRGRECVECQGEWEWDMGRGVMSASYSIASQSTSQYTIKLRYLSTLPQYILKFSDEIQTVIILGQQGVP